MNVFLYLKLLIIFSLNQYTNKRLVCILVHNTLFDSTEEIYCSHVLKHNKKIKIVKIYQKQVLPSILIKWIKKSDVIVSRSLTNSWLLSLKKAKIKFYYLIDDDVIAGINDSSISQNYKEKLTHIKSNVFPFVQSNAKKVLVCSSYLKDVYQKLFGNRIIELRPVFVSPKPIIAEYTKPELNIIYAASSLHLNDIKFVEPMITYILNTYSHVKFHIIGGNSLSKSTKKHKNIKLYKNMFWNKYKKFALSLNADIAICPVLNTPFNQGKSYIKFFDITRFGAIGVYSYNHFYSEIIHNNKNGFLLKNDLSEWVNQIEYLINNPKELIGLRQKSQLSAIKISEENFAHQTRVWNNEIQTF